MVRTPDTRPGWRRPARGTWLPVMVVLAVLVSGVAVVVLDLDGRWLGLTGPDPATEPAEVEPPEGLDLPPLAAPPAVAAPRPAAAAGSGTEETATLRRARVRRALRGFVGDEDLGRHVVAGVATLDGSGRSGQLLVRGAGRFVPASTVKLLTAAAALEVLGPQHRFTTSVLPGQDRGTVVLRGGGDPYLARAPVPADERATTYPERADLVTLARRTARTLRSQGRDRVRVQVDTSLFSGPAGNPAWEPDYVPDDVVSPVRALWVNQGVTPDGSERVDRPAARAAQVFVRALRRAGVTVPGPPRAGRARTSAATQALATVRGAPLSEVVERMLAISDNEAAEVLAHHVGLAVHGEGSFRAGARGTLATLREAGVPLDGVVLRDGSGLARGNRLTVPALVGVLRLVADPDRPALRPVLTGLPVARFTGSLSYRFDDTPAAGPGRVRAKTGTLTGVSSLAGVVTPEEGPPLLFVVAADRVDEVDTLDARQALDRAAAALAGCRCAR